jgi:hypothetical protein
MQIFLQEVYGYRWSSFRSALMWLGVILTLGALRLVFHWYRQWLLYATHTPCSLSDATKLLVVVSCSSYFIFITGAQRNWDSEPSVLRLKKLSKLKCAGVKCFSNENVTRGIDRPWTAGSLVWHETRSFYDEQGHLKLLACELNDYGLERKFVWLAQLI